MNHLDGAMTSENFLVKSIDNILPDISVIFVHSSQRHYGQKHEFIDLFNQSTITFDTVNKLCYLTKSPCKTVLVIKTSL